MKIANHTRALLAALLVLGLMASGFAFGQGRQPQPPEYKEIVAASQIRDAAARLRELERIKLAYPASQLLNRIDGAMRMARIELAETLDAVLALQNEDLADPRTASTTRLVLPSTLAEQILAHPKLAAFDPAAVLAAIAKYKDQVRAAAADPATFERVPRDGQDYIRSRFVVGFEIFMAQAYLNAGQTAQAAETLAAYRREGGPSDGSYHHVLGRVLEAEGKMKEAYESYLAAAVDNNEEAKDKAQALYVRINGREDGFEAALESQLKALPFHPEPFKAPADAKGKVVLAELFTGSECPPCVASDIAFDALIETFPAKSLAVLVYHLPIPRPDPMMNPATGARQDFYGVNSTPTVFIDGVRNATGGGNRGMAEGKFAEYRAAIEPLLSSPPAVAPKVRASISGDKVVVSFDPDKAVPEAAYHVVLVQDEQEHKGGNGIVFHKMVVRDILAVDPKGPGTATFDLAASERAADAYLTEFEKTYTRVPDFKWGVRRNGLPRRGLKVVFFVQDGASRKVLNAAVADVL